MTHDFLRNGKMRYVSKYNCKLFTYVSNGKVDGTEISADGLLSSVICVIMGVRESLPPGGRWHAKRDGRSTRDFKLELTSL